MSRRKWKPLLAGEDAAATSPKEGVRLVISSVARTPLRACARVPHVDVVDHARLPSLSIFGPRELDGFGGYCDRESGYRLGDLMDSLTRRLIALAGVLMLFAAGCGGNISTTTTTTTATASTQTPVSTQAPAATQAPTTTAVTAPADIIFYNGPVITMESAIPVAEALAVTDGLIIAVGSTDDILRYEGAGTLMVDLDGRALLPGFIDSHGHWIGDRGMVGLDTPQAAVAAALRGGWTSISEMFVNQERLDELVRLDEAGDLLIRVNAYLPVNYHDDHYGVWFAGYTPRHEYSLRLRIAGAKIFVDRSDDPTLMLLSEPHSDQPGFFGHASWTQDELTAMVSALHSDGWQVTIHTAGDGAADLVLNAFAAALNGESNDAFRHRIEHAMVLRDDQIQRMSDMGIVASIQLTWLHSDWLSDEEYWGPLEAALGPDRVAWLGRWRDLLDAGVKVIGGTDTPWTPAESAVGALYEAATRIGENGATPASWMLDQRITVEEALRLITIDAAYGTFDEEVKGSLAPGKWADLVVLSDNPLEIDINDLPRIDVLATIVGGQIVYCAPTFAGLCG